MASSSNAQPQTLNVSSSHAPPRQAFTLRWRSDRCEDHEQCAYEKLVATRCHNKDSLIDADETELDVYTGRACDPMLSGWTYELTVPGDVKRDALSTMEIVSDGYGEREPQEILWTRSGLYFKPESVFVMDISVVDDGRDAQLQFNAIGQQQQESNSDQPSETPLILTLLAAVVALLYAIANMGPSESFGSEANTRSTGNSSGHHTEPLLPRTSGAESQKPIRLTSLDAFRGLTICLMIFVNYGGGGFQVFNHSVWDGVTVADLVFPWFAWIMGFGIFLSAYNSVLQLKPHQAQQRSPPRFSILARSLRLFALGLFLSISPDWSHWRIPGVLQALSMAYFAVAMVDSVFPPRPRDLKHPQRFILSHVGLGLLPLVILNLSATFLLHVPGCPTGYLGPGGTSNGGKFQNCTGGAHLYVDTLLFGRNHLFQSPTCQKVYHTGAFDPEGALNWLMVAVTTYLGYISAALVVVPRQLSPAGTKQQRIQTLAAIGVVCFVASVVSGGVLVAQKPWVPLNKNLWSISYVLLSSGLACLLQMILFIGVESSTTTAAGSWSGWPLVSVGKNSIVIYVMVKLHHSRVP